MPFFRILILLLLKCSWGRNQNGQLGIRTTEDSLVPQKIKAFQVSAIFLMITTPMITTPERLMNAVV